MTTATIKPTGSLNDDGGNDNGDVCLKKAVLSDCFAIPNQRACHGKAKTSDAELNSPNPVGRAVPLKCLLEVDAGASGTDICSRHSHESRHIAYCLRCSCC